MYGHDQEGALPAGELICDDVQVSTNSNSFDDIVDAVRQERNYAGISSEDVMRRIPRGLALHPSKPGWLTCRHCRRHDTVLAREVEYTIQLQLLPRSGARCTPTHGHRPRCCQGTVWSRFPNHPKLRPHKFARGTKKVAQLLSRFPTLPTWPLSSPDAVQCF